MIVMDVKGELYKTRGQSMIDGGYDVKVVDFINPNPYFKGFLRKVTRPRRITNVSQTYQSARHHGRNMKKSLYLKPNGVNPIISGIRLF